MTVPGGARDALEMWVVYDHPTDDPAKFVARRWRIADGRVSPTDGIRVAEALDDLRAQLSVEGLVPIAVQPGDDPVIVESWL
jgi:hypothetical protein